MRAQWKEEGWRAGGSSLGEDTPYPEMAEKDSTDKSGGEEKEDESPDVLLQTPT